MTEWIRDLAELSARLLEAIGIGIVVLGALAASALFARDIAQKCGLDASYRRYRRGLGRAILLGLEFMVGADIIATVAVEPTFRSVGILGVIVIIRTFLSFSLEVEIDGHWPWQSRSRESGKHENAETESRG